MMTEEQRIEWLLELQEHPEQLTEEQLQQILADEDMRQLVQQDVVQAGEGLFGQLQPSTASSSSKT